MKLTYILLAAALAVLATPAAAQDAAPIGSNTLKIVVRSEETREPVAGARISVAEPELAATTDAAGRAELAGIPDGARTIEIFSPGFETRELKLVFPLAGGGELAVTLKVSFEAGQVIVNTTRTGRVIEDTPTRVEAIDEEEVDEKSNMRSSNVSMILNESTGIKVQQTSATSYTQSIRIQGLDGRYTQILKDGFPAFGGFSGSLSLLDIPPLDLKQVEIVKGPAATFYGGGAIAGVVNFISKEPEEQPHTSLIFNQTSARGTDFSLFDTRRKDRFGYTFLGTVNYQKEYDADEDDFTELPLTKSFNLNPRLFFYPDARTRLMIGNSTTRQSRRGGDMLVIDGRPDAEHQYFEDNHSLRNITTAQFDRDFAGGRRLVARQSLAFFRRELEIPDYRFDGRQLNSYTDVAFFQPVKSHALVFGATVAYDRFRERSAAAATPPRRETRATFGAYVQDSFNVTEKLAVEAGFRLDAVKDYGAFALPRVSLLYRFDENWSSRLTVGFGYKAPSIFTEEAETLLFENVLPIGNALEAETSRGGTLDFNYRKEFGEEFSVTLNQMFFYTEIADPLVLVREPGRNLYAFANAAARVKTRGFETNLRAAYNLVKLFAGYTYTDARAGYLAGNQILPLTPKSKLNSALLLEKEDDFKAGLEAYYTSAQFLTSRERTRPYWVVGIFGEKIFGKFSLFVNAENITDTRQSRFGPVVFPPRANPTFAEIYTHTEGRIFNGGIKIKL